jgi:hypothetical protein
MPDENRFAGIGDAVGDDGDADGTDEADEPDDAVEGDDVPSTPADGATDEQSTDAAPTESDTSTDDASTTDDTAAFEFDDTVQKSVYVRPETFETLEDAEALVDAQLRTDHEVKDLTRREFFDAVFAEAADDTDRLVERILQMRER